MIIFVALTLSTTKSSKVDCDYYIDYRSEKYSCEMRNSFEKPAIVTSVSTSNHLKNKNSCDVKIFHVNFNARSTKYYPTKICREFRNLQQIYLNSPSVVEMKRHIFKWCGNLRIIHIANMQLEILDEDLFWNVTSLRKLTIYNTQLMILQKDIFKHNPNLKKIWLNMNQLKVIEADFPRNLMVLSLLHNDCIDDFFNFSEEISTPLKRLLRNVKQKC